jgi:hypothetical protein
MAGTVSGIGVNVSGSWAPVSINLRLAAGFIRL